MALGGAAGKGGGAGGAGAGDGTDYGGVQAQVQAFGSPQGGVMMAVPPALAMPLVPMGMPSRGEQPMGSLRPPEDGQSRYMGECIGQRSSGPGLKTWLWVQGEHTRVA